MNSTRPVCRGRLQVVPAPAPHKRGPPPGREGGGRGEHEAWRFFFRRPPQRGTRWWRLATKPPGREKNTTPCVLLVLLLLALVGAPSCGVQARVPPEDDLCRLVSWNSPRPVSTGLAFDPFLILFFTPPGRVYVGGPRVSRFVYGTDTRGQCGGRQAPRDRVRGRHP